MANQTKTGKAFEFALLTALEQSLSDCSKLKMVQDASYQTALSCYEGFSSATQKEYDEAAVPAVLHLQELEPRLRHAISQNDELELRILSDHEAIKGDVRDIIGNKDFYKVIKGNKQTTIQGFNLHGSFNKRTDTITSKFKVPRLKFPSRIIELDFKRGSSTSLILICDQGWQISFRIHSASTKVESSLKFDINLEGQPESLYTHNMYWD
ncbi:MAG: HaeIII family restriction endonuclease [Verrucomicrobiota bacterium]